MSGKLELNPDGTLDIYSDFEETLTQLYSQQKFTMDKILEESLPDIEERKKFRNNFDAKRKAYLNNQNPQTYKEYFRALGEGILTQDHIDRLVESWELNPDYLKTLSWIKEISGAKKIRLHFIVRGFKQPMQLFIDKLLPLFELHGIEFADLTANELIFNKKGIYTGEIKEPFIINKALHVPRRKLFIGDSRDENYKFSHFVNIRDPESIRKIPVLFGKKELSPEIKPVEQIPKASLNSA